MDGPRNHLKRLQDRLLGLKWGSTITADSPVWMLGVCYQPSPTEMGEESGPVQDTAEFLHDFASRIWLTYRRGFEAMGATKLTSDVHWGCMLRSGQMLLAQALVSHYLGRAWRRIPDQTPDQKYLEILESFGDFPGESSPFSIHNLMEAGKPHGLVVGSWLGPYALCRTIEALAREDTEGWRNGSRKRALPMALYVVSGDADGERGGAPVLCVEDVKELCTTWAKGSIEWAPLLVLVPLVLGVDKVNPRYLPSLRATFCFTQTLGIAGGKAGSSSYLLGTQDDQALYLDPHEVQQVVRICAGDNSQPDTSSYHCSVVRKVPLEAIDPSLLLGFYCKNQDDFEDFCKQSSDLAEQSNGAPMFTVAETRSPKLTSESSFTKLSMEVEESSSANVERKDRAPSPEDDWQIV